jgi:hypothetical protein
MKGVLAGSTLSSVVWFGLSVASGQTTRPWAGAAVGEWTRASQAVVLTDMNQCAPASALSPRLKKGCWKVLPYETTSGLKGTMAWAGPEADAPELTLPLKVKGWHAVFVGLFSTSEVPTVAWLRLNTDPAPVNRSNSRNDYYGNSEEVFLKVAELGEDGTLQIGQQRHGFTSACGVTHVRLIPLTQAEIEAIREDRADTSHRTLTATLDGFSFIYYRSPRTPEEWLSEVEIYRDTDFGLLLLHSPGADKTSYPSQVGHMAGQGFEVFARIGDRQFADAIREMAAKGINPMKLLIDGAHDAGMKVHVGIRPAGWSFFEPYSEHWETPFYQRNPQWRCSDRDGTPVTRMSWAVPEVRRHLIDLLREQVRFGADGAHLCFNRGYPVALYEPPARELFQKQHGQDPRQVPESDPRIAQWRSDIVTTFMRELRAMLDEEGSRRLDRKRLEISIMILGTAQDDLKFGVDIRRLAAEGLIDAVSTERGFGRSTNDCNLGLLRDACRPKGVPFCPGTLSSATWQSEIPAYYDGGARGVAIWDAAVGDIYEWMWVSRFGHVDETRYRLKNLRRDQPPRTIHRFHKLGDQVRDGRYGPEWGG